MRQWKATKPRGLQAEGHGKLALWPVGDKLTLKTSGPSNLQRNIHCSLPLFCHLSDSHPLLARLLALSSIQIVQALHEVTPSQVEVPGVQKLQKVVEVPQIEIEEQIVEVPVVPMIQKVRTNVEAGFVVWH